MDPAKIVPIGTKPQVKEEPKVPKVEVEPEDKPPRPGSLFFANQNGYSTQHSAEELKAIIKAIETDLFMF